MIAMQYPPMKGSSGLQRILCFSRYLADYGWHPIVLTVNPGAYEVTSPEQVADIPDSAIVKRTVAFDAKRHLSIFGVYPRIFALPDRWSSWAVTAVPVGKMLIRKFRPSVIWSSFPIATAHVIGERLCRESGLPWIADFRDSMTEDNFPTDETIRASLQAVEKNTVARAAKCVFTAPSAIEMYANRYAQFPDSHWELISNGYDEASFEHVPVNPPHHGNKDKLVLVHSGLLDPVDRNPEHFFAAVARLKDESYLSGRDTEIRLRATGFDDHYRERITKHKIDDIINLSPSIPYIDALTEMAQADGLVLFQASVCNHQIPAKVYEYFRSGRPILGLVDKRGDTGRLLHSAGIDEIGSPDDSQDTLAVVRRFIGRLRVEQVSGVAPDFAGKFSRQYQARQLADLCNQLANCPVQEQGGP